MNENKKYSINNMLLAFITFLGVVGLVALTGFFLLTPPDDIIMGQAEATQVRISGKVPGRIEAYRFSEGDKVKVGDTLVFLDTPEVLAKLQQAEAVRRAAEAQNAKAIKGARAQEIAGAYEMWQKAKAGLDIAQKSYTRVQNLFDKGVMSAQKRDEAEASYKAMAATEKAAKSQYDMAVDGARVEDKAAAAALVWQAAGAVAEVAVDVDPQLQRDLACLIDGNAHLRNAEQVLGLLVLRPLGHPGVQSTALVGIGEFFRIQIAPGAVAVQGQGQVAAQSGTQLFLRHVGRNGDHCLGILRQGDLPFDVGVCGIGICQGLSGGTSVLRHVCDACERRCGEYESEDQDKRQDLRRQTGSFVLHSFLLFFSFFSMVVLGGRPMGPPGRLRNLPPTASAGRKFGVMRPSIGSLNPA